MKNTRLSLPREGLIAVRDGQNTRIDCLTGAVWVTQEGAIKDEVLEAGDSLVVQQPGLTLITALVPATVTLAEPAEANMGRRPTTMPRRAWNWLALPIRNRTDAH